MLYIILALVFYTIALFIAAIASRNANSTLVAGIVNAISTIIPFAVILPSLNQKMLQNGKVGILWALAGGVAIALFTMSFNKSLQLNKVAIVAPIVFGGAIFLSAILSYFFLKEKISFVQGIGLLFLAIGLGLIVYAKATGR